MKNIAKYFPRINNKIFDIFVLFGAQLRFLKIKINHQPFAAEYHNVQEWSCVKWFWNIWNIKWYGNIIINIAGVEQNISV